MNNIYLEYNSTWLKVKNKLEYVQNINIYDLIFGEDNSIFNRVISNGKIINIDDSEKLNYWEKSRKYMIDNLDNNDYDLIVELGSGYGRNIFYYLYQFKNKLINTEIISGEYTQGGCDTQNYIKNKFFNDSNLKIYRFDYNNSKDFFLNISNKYKNILILTFWSIEQVTYLNDDFFNNILNLKCDKLKVINIEPIGWQISEKSLMKENKTGYRSYYNKNLYIKLKELENKNVIKINNIILDFFNFDEIQSSGTLIEWEKIF